jgi:wyosine [tRNA(Phe)-imidazoG37] synthetase (radical SAM superfamily)
MATHDLHTRHERRFRANRYVYPVLSRRAGGISLGINLNPDKRCNFDCVYCQVDRTELGPLQQVDVPALVAELRDAIARITSGAIYETGKFHATPQSLRHFRDIAFSGDGEPTTVRNFDSVVTATAEVKRSYGLGEVKLVLITNASRLHRPKIQKGLATLDANQGEIWAKLDAGTEDYYAQILRTAVPFRQILANITAAAQVRPIVIQSLWMQTNGQGPMVAEQEAFCDRLNEITAAGGRISLVQVSTVARRPAETFVTPLADHQIDALTERVQSRTGLPAAAYYG